MNIKMILRLILIAATLSLGTSVSAEEAKTKRGANISIDDKLLLIKRIESTIVMPKRAHKLTTYQRLYAFKKDHENEVILGFFLRTAEKGAISE